MQAAVIRMLDQYHPQSADQAVGALREILQQIALLGLWRAKFFEHAAFYGGTALRILHGLDRFSEDLDFTLVRANVDFDLGRYIQILETEIQAFGFDMHVVMKQKAVPAPIQSAFLKGNTRNQMLVVEIPAGLVAHVPRDQSLKIKLEVDTDPPGGIVTDTRYLLQPIPFAVRVCDTPCLFAGKMHAVLCRQWKGRVKGRDWYDFVWFVANHPRLDLRHLEARMRQTGHWQEPDPLSPRAAQDLLGAAIMRLDVDQARREVRPFLNNPESTDVWSCDFFHDIARRIVFQEK